MRGLITHVLVLGMIFPIAILLSATLSVHGSMQKNSIALLKIESDFGTEMEIKNVFRQVMESVGKSGLDWKVTLPSKIALLENAMEGKFAADGKKLDLWFGTASEIEIGMIEKSGTKMYCKTCHDFSYLTFEYDKKTPAFFSTAFLFPGEDGFVVSKKGLIGLPKGLDFAYVIKPAYFGAILQNTKDDFARAILMPEGFG